MADPTKNVSNGNNIKKAILIPGNGCGSKTLDDCMWYPWIAKQLQGSPFHVDMNLSAFPDHLYAREHIWKKFVTKDLGPLDENTILIGHSSGAACALRLMEEHRTGGVILVSAYNDDLGDETEAASGYFSRPFQYKKMRENTPWIVQFHSSNDHLVPVQVAREVAKELRDAGSTSHKKTTTTTKDGGKAEQEDDEECDEDAPTDFSSSAAVVGTFEYIELPLEGHFQEDEYQQFVQVLSEKLLPQGKRKGGGGGGDLKSSSR